MPYIETVMYHLENPFTGRLYFKKPKPKKLKTFADAKAFEAAELKRNRKAEKRLKDAGVSSPGCSCRFTNDFSNAVILCEECSKLPCHNKEV